MIYLNWLFENMKSSCCIFVFFTGCENAGLVEYLVKHLVVEMQQNIKQSAELSELFIQFGYSRGTKYNLHFSIANHQEVQSITTQTTFSTMSSKVVNKMSASTIHRVASNNIPYSVGVYRCRSIQNKICHLLQFTFTI